MNIQPEKRTKLEMSLAQAEQADQRAFEEQPRDPCDFGHLWVKYSSGEVECTLCGTIADILDWD